MATYEVVIHTHKGYRFVIDADSADEAESFALHAFVEAGEDGDEIVYETREGVDVSEVTR